MLLDTVSVRMPALDIFEAALIQAEGENFVILNQAPQVIASGRRAGRSVLCACGILLPTGIASDEGLNYRTFEIG
jgi:hypothetical protein